MPTYHREVVPDLPTALPGLPSAGPGRAFVADVVRQARKRASYLVTSPGAECLPGTASTSRGRAIPRRRASCADETEELDAWAEAGVPQAIPRTHPPPEWSSGPGLGSPT